MSRADIVDLVPHQADILCLDGRSQQTQAGPGFGPLVACAQQPGTIVGEKVLVRGLGRFAAAFLALADPSRFAAA
jgi:hypothetical protein